MVMMYGKKYTLKNRWIDVDKISKFDVTMKQYHTGIKLYGKDGVS